MNNTFKLGRSIVQLVPFITHRQQEDKPIITNKVLILFAVIAAIKVIILLAWR